MKNFFDVAELVVNSAHGIYVAQSFVKSFRFEQFEGLSIDDYSILLSGPDNEDYVQTWADQLEQSKVKDGNGEYWLILQIDGDLYVYPESADINWEEIELL